MDDDDGVEASGEGEAPVTFLRAEAWCRVTVTASGYQNLRTRALAYAQAFFGQPDQDRLAIVGSISATPVSYARFGDRERPTLWQASITVELIKEDDEQSS